MANKDNIFQSFIEHPLIKEYSNKKTSKLPSKIFDGKKSENLIVKIIALIVEQSEGKVAVKEKALFEQINKIIKLES
jgi:hypothetical protein